MNEKKLNQMRKAISFCLNIGMIIVCWYYTMLALAFFIWAQTRYSWWFLFLFGMVNVLSWIVILIMLMLRRDLNIILNLFSSNMAWTEKKTRRVLLVGGFGFQMLLLLAFAAILLFLFESFGVAESLFLLGPAGGLMIVLVQLIDVM